IMMILGVDFMRRIKEFMPSIIGLFISIIAFIVYIMISEKIAALTCVQILVVPIILFLLQGLNMTNKISIPILFHYLLLLHLILALILGSGFNFYDKIACWDMILHGYFGFIFSVLVCILLLNYNGEKINSFLFFILIFFVTMGAASLWEIYEFVMDTLLDGDAQRIQESISQGHTPVYDTMMDMIVAILGITVFYISIGIDKMCKYKWLRYIYQKIKKADELS
ncbi:MAG: hypothetical protein K2J85_02115, partial [Anaeroplasmataceae bacterium]|nr:hypothetical protein [Anaeroplasmataceae bacterium]